jgi:hypothetical protein
LQHIVFPLQALLFGLQLENLSLQDCCEFWPFLWALLRNCKRCGISFRHFLRRGR